MRLDAAVLFRQLDAGRDIGDEEEEVVAAPTLGADEIARRKEERKQKRMKEKMARDQEGILSLQEEIAKLEEKLGKGKFSKQEERGDDNDEGNEYLDAIDGAREMLKRQYDGEQGSSTDSDDDEVRECEERKTREHRSDFMDTPSFASRFARRRNGSRLGRTNPRRF